MPLRQLLAKAYFSTYTNPIVARCRILIQSLHRDYQIQRSDGLKKLMMEDLNDLRVVGGPFKGMLYPGAVSLGSAFTPKLLGVYELELHEHIERLLSGTTYDVIVDVGAAEGYYAVGFARRCPVAKVITYDINPKSKLLVSEFARANEVSDRVEVRGFCDHNELIQLSKEYRRGLLVSDCEGYELDLLSSSSISALVHWDILVETHDSLETKITKPLVQRLKTTHQVNVVRQQRRRLRDFPQTRGERSSLLRLAAMDEGRCWRSKWLCCYSR